MKYREVAMDLFEMPEEYHLMHCISSDLAMGKGIAVEFNKRFQLKAKMVRMKIPKQATAIKVGRVINMITKERYWHKPTTDTFKAALKVAKSVAEEYDIKKIAIPTIGSDLDKLEWAWVRDKIKSTFEDTDVEIVVCVNNPIEKCPSCDNGMHYVRNNRVFCTGCDWRK